MTDDESKQPNQYTSGGRNKTGFGEERRSSGMSASGDGRGRVKDPRTDGRLKQNRKK